MSFPASMPSLFGRGTVLLQDHDQLRATLRELKALCAAIEDGRLAPQGALVPQRLFETLNSDLSQHFGAEESEDYFGTVMTEEPELKAAIEALKAEHATILGAVDMLVRLSVDPSRWSHLPGPTRLLVEQLERHEGAESELLRSFFFDA